MDFSWSSKIYYLLLLIIFPINKITNERHHKTLQN